MSKELIGGFINRVYRENGSVVKVFGNDELVGISSDRRKRNEAVALLAFGGEVAPKLLDEGDGYLVQEFVEGEMYETRARRGEGVFEEAGQLLAKIHRLFPGNLSMLRRYYEKRFVRAMGKAGEILGYEKATVEFGPDWEEIDRWRVTCLHKDFWLANVLGDQGQKPRVVDWEFAGVGSPYEDFAIVDLWIIREFERGREFWNGYGREPHQETVEAFLRLKCVEFLATTNLPAYIQEGEDGFYHNKVLVLRTLR